MGQRQSAPQGAEAQAHPREQSATRALVFVSWLRAVGGEGAGGPGALGSQGAHSLPSQGENSQGGSPLRNTPQCPFLGAKGSPFAPSTHWPPQRGTIAWLSAKNPAWLIPFTLLIHQLKGEEEGWGGGENERKCVL